ncbi:lipid II:glycine glycyltransferase FemX [Haladaptatus sp. CMSO5]|uniref:lipid II:glycine glycyltransferase FemX n=1 Tax=Haladaptatus sp. CMSO5 TaxID=3120514 RepID=UPI002FCDF9F2
MTVTISLADVADQQRWNNYVAASPQGTFFHQLEVLDVLATHSQTDLTLLIGKKGNEVVGLLPMFVTSKFGINVAFSPPPRLKVPYLGSLLLNSDDLRQRTFEDRHEEFVEGCFDYLHDTVRPRYFNIRSTVGYPDVRPYLWQDFEILPRYTYQVDLTPGIEELFAQFSSDARYNIRKATNQGISVEIGGVEAIKRIIAQVSERHHAQGKSFPVNASLVTDLYNRLPAGSVLPYEAYLNGTYVGGNIVVSFGNTVCAWFGGVAPEVDVPVNECLDWRIITDATNDGMELYDFLGANVRRINRYKAKFNPELRPYFNIERASPEMAVVAGVYKLLS